MSDQCVIPEEQEQIAFLQKVENVLPERGHLDMCLTCGLCSAACPATGLEGMDPRKFLRMAALGMDKEVTSTPWVWLCTMCQRCRHVCPMSIDIPRMVYNARAAWPRDKRPRGIVKSCDAALATDTFSAMGISPEDFVFVVEDVLEEVRETQECCKDLQAPINKQNAMFYLNQNSREPGVEPDEMVPLWKILNYVGADWTYGTAGWAAENYCMFAADDESWKRIVTDKVKAVEDLGATIWLNTE